MVPHTERLEMILTIDPYHYSGSPTSANRGNGKTFDLVMSPLLLILHSMPGEGDKLASAQRVRQASIYYSGIRI